MNDYFCIISAPTRFLVLPQNFNLEYFSMTVTWPDIDRKQPKCCLLNGWSFPWSSFSCLARYIHIPMNSFVFWISYGSYIFYNIYSYKEYLNHMIWNIWNENYWMWQAWHYLCHSRGWFITIIPVYSIR